MPTLIVMGTDSHYASEKLWEYLKHEIPDHRFLLLKGGHNIHVDAEELFNREVKRFLETAAT